MTFSLISSYLHRCSQAPAQSCAILIGFLLAGLAIAGLVRLSQSNTCNDDLITANKRFRYEPAIFARFRWITNAQSILQSADQKAQGRPYRLFRGDTDQIILPPSLIPELNGLGLETLNSRESHSFGLLGHLTGMDVVRVTSFHVRVLLSYISPALPSLFTAMGDRISAGIPVQFPQNDQWAPMKLHKAVVHCISEAIALILFGAEMTQDNPELVHLAHDHTNNVFQVCFAMRCVPQAWQPVLVWLLPAKWRLLGSWKRLRGFVVPKVLQKAGESRTRDGKDVNPDVISWMVESGRSELERDPENLTTLVGSIAAGSTYSIANFCCRTIADLVGHPDFLGEVCEEIRRKNAEVHGSWKIADIASLPKLESAMKESSRLSPGTFLVYSRVVKKDCVLSNGLRLRKGQFITISAATRTMDPSIFEDPQEYHGLRFCAEDRINEHRGRPFSSVDTDILTWGAGRWACPGRLITDVSAKILLIKLLDEYEFAFVHGKPLPGESMHEFLFFHPENQMLVRRREESCGIVFV